MSIHPDLYHGEKKHQNFFEGWYFKIVDPTNKYTLALIPGIAFGENRSEHHAFVQVVNFVDFSYDYYRYPVADFSTDKKPLQIRVANNEFSFKQISVTTKAVSGELALGELIKWPDSKLNPGSMGFYNHFPFMECYTQVCALDGIIKGGMLNIGGRVIDFTGGRFYIEKNWGKSFPSSWIWIQSNSFPDHQATVTCSLGVVPMPGGYKFRGFLIGVTVDNKFYRFTTINRSSLTLNVEDHDIILYSQNKFFSLILKTKSNPDDFLQCYGPKNGKMIPYVKETLKGTVEMTLIDKRHEVIVYHGVGENCGIEISQ